MGKVGIELPGILKWIMKFSMRKFDKLAKENNVQLIGQVTGANGALLQNLTDFLTKMTFITREYPTRNLLDIEKNGLSKSDLGKIIIF